MGDIRQIFSRLFLLLLMLFIVLHSQPVSSGILDDLKQKVKEVRTEETIYTCTYERSGTVVTGVAQNQTAATLYVSERRVRSGYGILNKKAQQKHPACVECFCW